MSHIVIVTESGSDLTPEQATAAGVRIVPMHVSIGSETFDNGERTAADMLEQCSAAGQMPHTSASTPADYTAVFDAIEAEDADAQILHLAYSAATTSSFEAAAMAAKGRSHIRSVDTKFVSAALGFIARRTAQYVRDDAAATLDDAAAFAQELSGRVRMAFVPFDLRFLKEGGRLTNAAYLGAQLLRIKPVVAIEDGRLVATRKLRGSKLRVMQAFLDDMLDDDELDRDLVILLRSPGLDPALQQAAEQRARELGYERIEWSDTQCVITSHCGPATLGAVALARA